MLGLGLFSEFYKRTEIVGTRRFRQLSRKLLQGRRLPEPRGFFDDYPRFYSSSETAATSNRLNQRYRACIDWNKKAIAGKRILDLASHDGRWSFAAMKAGAKSVFGIEARDYLVQNAIDNFRHYGIPDESFRFIGGDVFESFDKIEPGSIDTVLCFGFFYHQGRHMHLLNLIAALRPQFLIIDTALHLDPYPIIFLYEELPEGEANAARIGAGSNRPYLVSGSPSKPALDMMLRHFGWKIEYYHWHNSGITQWDDMPDYHEGWRVTVRADCR